MNEQELIVLNTLLSRSGFKNKAMNFLPSDISGELRKVAGVSNIGAMVSAKRWMLDIHYTWFVEALKNIPVEAQKVFLGIFHGEELVCIKKLLGLEDFTPAVITKKAEMYLSNLFKKYVLPLDLLDEASFTEQKIFPLFLLSGAKLTVVARILGLHDLAAQMKSVLDRKVWDKINAELNKEEQGLLDYYSKQMIKYHVQDLNFENSLDKLDIWLQKQGLVRLGFALTQEHPFFVWHILRKLDVARAHVLQSAVKQHLPEVQNLVSYFQDQVLFLVKRYN